MRLVCLSDTHKRHEDVLLPDGDVLVFAGDMCGGGGEGSARRFIHWFGKQRHKEKVMIAGNHDRCFDSGGKDLLKVLIKEGGIRYLEHESERIGGVNFFGSPYQPEFCNWAFNVRRGDDLARLWSQIPVDTEVLITHGPPFGILDMTGSGERCGCEDLRRRVDSLPCLKVNIFGHIHYSYGTKVHNGAKYVNVSICGEDYEPTNKPVVIELLKEGSLD